MNGTVRSGSRNNMWSTWYKLSTSIAPCYGKARQKEHGNILIRDAFVFHILVTVNKQLWNNFMARWLVWRCAHGVYQKHENDTASLNKARIDGYNLSSDLENTQACKVTYPASAFFMGDSCNIHCPATTLPNLITHENNVNSHLCGDHFNQRQMIGNERCPYNFLEHVLLVFWVAKYTTVVHKHFPMVSMLRN